MGGGGGQTWNRASQRGARKGAAMLGLSMSHYQRHDEEHQPLFLGRTAAAIFSPLDSETAPILSKAPILPLTSPPGKPRGRSTVLLFSCSVIFLVFAAVLFAHAMYIYSLTRASNSALPASPAPLSPSESVSQRPGGSTPEGDDAASAERGASHDVGNAAEAAALPAGSDSGASSEPANQNPDHAPDEPQGKEDEGVSTGEAASSTVEIGGSSSEAKSSSTGGQASVAVPEHQPEDGVSAESEANPQPQPEGDVSDESEGNPQAESAGDVSAESENSQTQPEDNVSAESEGNPQPQPGGHVSAESDNSQTQPEDDVSAESEGNPQSQPEGDVSGESEPNPQHQPEDESNLSNTDSEAVGSEMNQPKAGGEASALRAHPVVMYQFYDTTQAWPALTASLPYRGIAEISSQARPSSTNDLDAPAILSILQDASYQKLLREYGPMLAVGTLGAGGRAAENGAQAPWVGFQSWLAESKGIALSPEALRSLEMGLEGRGVEGDLGGPPEVDSNVFYYWGSYGGEDLYVECDSIYARCSAVVSAIFDEIFEKERTTVGADGVPSPLVKRPELLPAMPGVGRGFACCSHWIMSTDNFNHFLSFARMFFVAAESLWDVHSDADRCPLILSDPQDAKQNCWAYLMERLVNVWVYHSGLRMQFVEPASGQAEEQYPLPDRALSDWFARPRMEDLVSVFHERLSPGSRDLHVELGYEAMS